MLNRRNQTLPNCNGLLNLAPLHVELQENKTSRMIYMLSYFHKLRQKRSLGILFLGSLCLFSFANSANAQAFIATSANFYVHPSAEVGIFDSIQNNGVIDLNAGGTSVIHLIGNRWTNLGSATVTGSGKVIFEGTSAQELRGNAASTTFPSIQINNSNNVTLQTTDTKVRDTVMFTSGKFILNLNDFTVGNASPGVITGYDQNKYFVTGGTPTDTIKGYLKRESTGTGTVAFPIGNSVSEYTPASMANSGTSDDFKARVFVNVYSGGNKDTIQDKAIQRTYDIRETTSGGSNITLNLQHNTATQDANYDNNHAYIARYIGTAPNTSGDTTSSSRWDKIQLSNRTAGTATGTITTGAAISGASVLTRTGLTFLSFFTKTSSLLNTPLPVTLIQFSAMKAGELRSRISWSTAVEVNNAGFWVEKSEDGKIYKPWQWVEGKGNSYNKVDYTLYDEACVNGKNYYRLKQVDFNGKSTYSNSVVVQFGNANVVTTYPNPVADIMHIKFSNMSEPLQLSIMDISGKVIQSTQIETKNMNSGDLETMHLAPGTYLLRIHNSGINQFIQFNKINN